MREVVLTLEIRPELRRGAERAREKPSGRGRDTALAAHDFIDALKGNTEVRCERDSSEFERREEFLERYARDFQAEQDRFKSCTIRTCCDATHDRDHERRRHYDPHPSKNPHALTCYSGTIEYVDEGGERRRSRNGSVTMWRRWGLRWCVYEGEILDGGVFFEMPACNTVVDIGRIVVDGRETFVSAGNWAEPRWIARLAAPVFVSVFYAGSKDPLRGVEVRELDSTSLPYGEQSGFLVATHASQATQLPPWSMDPDPD